MNKYSVYIKTFGCQMNTRDSEFVMGILLDSGFRKADSPEGADIIIFNSCSVRKHAEDRLVSNIAMLKKEKARRPELIIGLMGCTAQNYKVGMFKKSPLLDFVCGPGNEADIPSIVKTILHERGTIVAVDKVDEKRPELFPSYRKDTLRALVSIGEGCNNFCSYCIVPYVRGRERSRRLADIEREVAELAENGFKEVMLLGQNVNSYSSGKHDFPYLLGKINRIKGIERIRFMTSHPKDASKELFEAMAGFEKVCEHLHLPLQSGSDRILSLMNRKYTRAKYIKDIAMYKKAVPKGSLTTDIIVGFPTETDKDFEDTVSLIKDVGFDNAFLFKYSVRPPAKASELADDVPRSVKEERLKTLLGLQGEISRSIGKALEGEVVDVLVEGQSDKDKSVLTGRTRTNKVVLFEGVAKDIGRLIKVEVERATSYALYGRKVS